MIPFESLGTVSYKHSIVTMVILYHFRDKAWYMYWSKIVTFSYSPAFHGPVRGGEGSCPNIAISFGVEKLERCGYPTVKKSWRICLAFLTQYRHTADRL